MPTSGAREIGSALPRDILTSESFDVSDSAGLFVGVRLFRDGRFAEVPCAIDDAVDLAHTFIQLGLVTAEKTVLCLHGEARKPETVERLDSLREQGVTRRHAGMTDIYAALDDQRLSCGERGIFLVGVASHGISHDGKDLVLAADTVPSALLRTSVEVTEIFNTIGKAKAPRRLVLLDACRERIESQGRSVADGDAGPPMTETFAEAISKATGQVVLSGTVSGGYSYDDTRRGNGVFSAAVIDGLRGKAPGDDRNLITVETLASFVESQVQDWLEQNAKDLLGIGKNFDGMCRNMPLAAAHQETTSRPSTAAEDEYRQEFREYLENDGEISPIERHALTGDRRRLGISDDVAASIEDEERARLATDTNERLEDYRAFVVVAIEAYGYPVPVARIEELKTQQTKLCLGDDDVAGITDQVAAEMGIPGVEATMDQRSPEVADAFDVGLLDPVVAGDVVDVPPTMVSDDSPSWPGDRGEIDDQVERFGTAVPDDLLSYFIESQILFEDVEQPGELDLADCATVTSVAEGSLAERLGVIKGDIVVSVNGIPGGRLGRSLHQSGIEPSRLELRTVRRGLVTVQTTGIEPGLGLMPTPEAIMADPQGIADAQNFAHLWELGETADLWTLSLRRAAVAGSLSLSELERSSPDEILELFERGDLDRDDLSMLYLGGHIVDTGDARGMELIAAFAEGGIRGYTMNHHSIADYYELLVHDTAVTRDETLELLNRLYARSEYERIASTIRRLGGVPGETDGSRIGLVFPIAYELAVLDERRTISLVDTLATLAPHQLHMICLMSRYRSNGPYHDTLFEYQNLAEHMPEFLPSLHVLTSSDGKESRKERKWFESWLGQEEAVRRAGLPIQVLFDEDDGVIEAVGSTGAPHVLLIDHEGIIRFDGAVDEFGAGVWTALHRLLREPAAVV